MSATFASHDCCFANTAYYMGILTAMKQVKPELFQIANLFLVVAVERALDT